MHRVCVGINTNTYQTSNIHSIRSVGAT